MNLTIVLTLVSALIMGSALYDTYYMWVEFLSHRAEITYKQLDEVVIIEITPRTFLRVISSYALSIILYPSVSLFCAVMLRNPAALLAAVFVAVLSLYSAVAGLMTLYNLVQYRSSAEYAEEIGNNRIVEGNRLIDFGLSVTCTLCVFYTVYCLFFVPLVA